MQSTSNICSSVSIYTFNKLMPAIFILPTFMPVFSHLFIRSVFFFLYRIEPFVRFLPLVYCVLFYGFLLFSLVSACVAQNGSSILFPSLFFIIISFAALAHWGAIPFPTPAGL
jgi:hypothetical protein